MRDEPKLFAKIIFALGSFLLMFGMLLRYYAFLDCYGHGGQNRVMVEPLLPRPLSTLVAKLLAQYL